MFKKSKPLKQTTLFNTSVLALMFVFLNGCTAKHEFKSERLDENHQQWLQSVINYKESNRPPAGDDLIIDQAFFPISEEMRSLVIEKFSHLRKNKASESLARWLMSKEGHNMQYDLSANLFPIDAFSQKRGNCLSFTILLVNLAKVLDIELKYNDVYLPNLWGIGDAEQDIVLFRHINAIRLSNDQTEIYDLAIEEYDYGYPQKLISEAQAAASLYSNIATQLLQKKDFSNAQHHMKYAISLHPKNPDFWVNLGVSYKKGGDFVNAEQSFLHALNLKDIDSLAASNLENLYREQGKTDKANYFNKIAARVKLKNPYVHYRLASDQLKQKRYSLARKSIARAKKLHNQDPRFYVLSSIIKQQTNDFVSAIKDIETAYKLTVSNQDRQFYSEKARLLAIKASDSRPDTFSDDLFDLNPTSN